ncbi:MAG: hypothetical protein FWF71_03050 [Actinomycetia bacterium]|nr:hypothetical protein [Actinomycetes bacterium]
MERQPFCQTAVSRRRFLGSAISAGAAILGSASILSLGACRSQGGSASNATAASAPASKAAVVPTLGEVTLDAASILRVSKDQVVQATDFKEAKTNQYLIEEERFDLPLGSQAYQIDSNRAIALVPRSEGDTLVDLNLLDLRNGKMSLLADTAAGTSQGHPGALVYDARASESVLAWTELDIADLSWQVYAAPLAASATGQAQLLDMGTSDYETPQLAVVQDKVYWTVMPNPSGAAQYQDSYLKTAFLGRGEPWTVLTSSGRLSCDVIASDGVVCVAPRVDDKNIYYRLFALSASDEAQLASLILPQSLRVSQAVWLPQGFCFSIEGNNPNVGGLSSFGTYWALPDGKWLCLGRMPSLTPVQLGNLFCARSTTSIVGLDVANGCFFAIPTLADSADYGDILMGWGVQDKLIVYGTVQNSNDPAKSKVIARVFSLKNGI